MNKIISISTGLVYKFIDGPNAKIEKLKDFNPSGIEIVLNQPEALLGFEPTQKNIDYLHELDFVTIHAPACKDMAYKDDEKTKQILDKLSALSKQIGSKNVTVHIDQIQDFGIFESCDFNISIENSDFRQSFGQSPKEMKKILKSYPSLGFTFDFAHAISANSEYIEEFLELSDRISEIHVSTFEKELLEHHFLFTNTNSMYKEKLRLLPKDKPLVIESTALAETEIPWIIDEIEFLQNI